MSSVIIIGGGAAGMAAAIAAASCGDRVTVLERMDRVGKKILATGNGRCNLMNTGTLRYPGGNKLAGAVLTHCGAEEQRRFWEHHGLRMRQEDGGRVYPISGAATSVLDTLRHAMRALRVETVTGAHVLDVSKVQNGWCVRTAENSYTAQRVIVAGGGCAQPKLGSDGSLWPVMTALGHRLVQPRPALTQIITDTAPIRGLSGIRVRSKVRITSGAAEKYREAGEVLFADYGVTGVCVMQCARYAAPGDLLHIDLSKAMGFADQKEMKAELLRRIKLWDGAAEGEATELLTGLCVPKISLALFRAAGIDPHTAVITKHSVDRLVQCAADFTLKIKGVKGFESAQVTAGGLACEQFDPCTLESRILPGIHAAGEILDVDGDCGGYNLMFAFGSGILAGLNGRTAPW